MTFYPHKNMIFGRTLPRALSATVKIGWLHWSTVLDINKGSCREMGWSN